MLTPSSLRRASTAGLGLSQYSSRSTSKKASPVFRKEFNVALGLDRSSGSSGCPAAAIAMHGGSIRCTMQIRNHRENLHGISRSSHRNSSQIRLSTLAARQPRSCMCTAGQSKLPYLQGLPWLMYRPRRPSNQPAFYSGSGHISRPRPDGFVACSQRTSESFPRSADVSVAGRRD
jgi:hypothetical protein